MKRHIKLLAALVVGTMLTPAFAQSAKEVRGASPIPWASPSGSGGSTISLGGGSYVEIKNVWIQYRVENLRIVPVFGEGATKALPRVGHLHITVDDLPWWWADASDNNTIDIAGLPVGEHQGSD